MNNLELLATLCEVEHNNYLNNILEKNINFLNNFNNETIENLIKNYSFLELKKLCSTYKIKNSSIYQNKPAIIKHIKNIHAKP